ncbi:uncharacterized protein LOC126757384 [Bactrocera neohumeralis]|uniref:uncharacterized protein LOC126757384 n=1 Tax=Bactrocera neohumeralis TaxID=98809 RepID=UPI00216681F6|nr:uncharacterized protein LOC126757384 [Bactrocera neohumeralis]XP_050327208.1 uncharacterized protein LOC126757384 [Bactrocera neohumeralis]
MNVTKSGVIIIDPSTFLKKKVVHSTNNPPNGTYKSTPSEKEKEKSVPHVPRTVKSLEDPIQKPTKLYFPSLSIEQNRKIQEIRDNHRKRNQLQNNQTSLNQNKHTEKPLDKFAPVCPENTPLTTYIEFINEALFDDEQLAKNQDIPAYYSGGEVLELEEQTLEHVLENPQNNSSATFTTNGVQTEEPSEDRINCGFVNVSKTGDDKYFNLRCFYCDAEFPISFWSEFSDHVIDTHGDLEKVFTENDVKSVSDVESLNDETDIFNEHFSNDDVEVHDTSGKKLFVNLIDKDRLNCLTIKPEVKELLPEHFDHGNGYDSFSDEEPYYMSAENYEVCLEHCYGRIRDKNKCNMKPGETIDQISFENTSREIVMDFLEHLKGFPNLWQSNSDLNIKRYKNELKDLLAIMTEKWSLNLKKSVLCKNVENIKAWFIGMTEAKGGRSNMKFTEKYIDYYTKCAEYMSCDGDLKKTKVYCDICKQFCYDAVGLQIHKHRRHNMGQLPYACNKCDKRFDYIHKLRKHLQRKHVVPGYLLETEAVCAECDQKFTDSREYVKHLEIHPKGNCHFACDVCGFRTRTAGILRHHKQRHQERVKNVEKIYECDECPFRCTTSSLLRQHKRRHREPTYQCELCPKRFHFSTLLKTHMSIHNGRYDYVCETCGKLFVRKTYLMDHVKHMHMGYGHCKICNRVYGKQCIFQKHLRTQHRPLIGTIEDLTRRTLVNSEGQNIGLSSGPRLKCRKYTYVIDPVTKRRTLKCPKCDKCYNQYDSLYAHYKKVHGDTVPGYTRRLTGNQKLIKNHKKTSVRSVSVALADPNVAEAAAAVNTILESTNIKDDSPISQSNRISNFNEIDTTDSKTTMESDIKEFQDVTPISSFEKFVNKMHIINDFAPDTANQPETTEKRNPEATIKVENCLMDFEYLLNNSSAINFS